MDPASIASIYRPVPTVATKTTWPGRDGGADADEIRGDGGNDAIAGDTFARNHKRNKDNSHMNHGIASAYD